MPPHIRDGLDRALQQARAMSDLVEALLLLLQGSDPESKARGELAQPVNLSDLVRDLDREFRDVERQRAGDFDLSAEDEVLVRGHSTLLTSAIRNLLSNAFKFTAAGQRVRVRVFNGSGRGTVVVEDAGPGIASADRERVPDEGRRGGDRLMLGSVDWVGWILLLARVVVVFVALLVATMLTIWVERKVVADMQVRVGPNRAGPFGILITLADGIKLFFKEGVIPTTADPPVWVVPS